MTGPRTLKSSAYRLRVISAGEVLVGASQHGRKTKIITGLEHVGPVGKSGCVGGTVEELQVHRRHSRFATLPRLVETVGDGARSDAAGLARPIASAAVIGRSIEEHAIEIDHPCVVGAP